VIDAGALTLEACIGQKLMLDIRRFAVSAGQAPAPVRQLPQVLAEGLASLAPCGVILFAENFDSIRQTLALTGELRAVLGEDALIGIDQEGGRVTRLPRRWATAFSGNMALAACEARRREALAQRMAEAQGRELAALGINLNFAPALDVNANPRNPVINVRAFGDDPEVVAALGAAVVRGLQGAGPAAAIKHFPGHGDTAVDSHTGLPRVDRCAASARAVDLAPFARVIRSAAPDLVMTAHIQYPALDNSTLPGTDVVQPATLSRRMVTDLLRGELGFDGVVISDALDMAAISELLDPAEAVLRCFQAGVDIALMPLLLRGPDQLAELSDMVARVAAAARAGELEEQALRRSAQRVLDLRARLLARCPAPVASGVAPEVIIGCPAHRALQRDIAEGAVTLVSGALQPLRPGQALHLLMPDDESSRALARALELRVPSLRVSGRGLQGFDGSRRSLEQVWRAVEGADACVLGVAEPGASGVVTGGAEDVGCAALADSGAALQALLRGLRGTPRIVLLLRSPYAAPAFAGCAEAVLASYDGESVGIDGAPGPAFEALAAVLSGDLQASGAVPVAL
jgi:beta-N-acetylhexosaminidase